MVKHTDPSHPDCNGLAEALVQIETVVTIVNEAARQTEGVHKMLALQNRFTAVSSDSFFLFIFFQAEKKIEETNSKITPSFFFVEIQYIGSF